MSNSNPQESLFRATSGQSFTNYAAIINGFMAKGIAEADILPRENVFTFNAWRAKGRIVKRGEHGVRCLTFIMRKDRVTGQERKTPWSTTVFHITQTEPTGQRAIDVQRNEPVPLRRAEAVDTRTDEEIVAGAKGKALCDLDAVECRAMMRAMERANESETLTRISETLPALPAIDVTPVASAETEYNPQLAKERVEERRYIRRAEQLRETAQWYTMLPQRDAEPIIGHLPGTKEYGQFKSWNRLTQEAQDALHYARTVNPQTPRERVLAGQPVSILDLMPDKIDKLPGQPAPLKPVIKKRNFQF